MGAHVMCREQAAPLYRYFHIVCCFVNTQWKNASTAAGPIWTHQRWVREIGSRKLPRVRCTEAAGHVVGSRLGIDAPEFTDSYENHVGGHLKSNGPHGENPRTGCSIQDVVTAKPVAQAQGLAM